MLMMNEGEENTGTSAVGDKLNINPPESTSAQCDVREEETEPQCDNIAVTEISEEKEAPDSIRQISEEKEELPAQSAGTTVVNVSADDDLTNSQSDDNKASLISTGGTTSCDTEGVETQAADREAADIMSASALQSTEETGLTDSPTTSLVTAEDESSQSAPVSGTATPTTTHKRTRITNSKLMLKSLPQGLGAESLFEYRWPANDEHAEYYMLQEQVSVFLDVKSFRRKYPDLERRQIEVEERNYLKDMGIVTEMQCDLGLNALKSDELSDLMMTDYPEKYEEYTKVLQKREEEMRAKRHQELLEMKNNTPVQAPISKTDIKRLTEKSVKAAANYNAFLMRERREARQHYFDIQTGVVHYPKTKRKPLPAEMTRPSPYPVSVLRGQYSEYYRPYSSDELKYLPIKSVLYNPPLRIHNPYTPLPPEQEVEEVPVHHQPMDVSSAIPAVIADIPRTDTPPNRRAALPVTAPPPPPKHVTKVVESMCAICFKEANRQGEKEKCIKCNSCGREAHASCSEVTPMLDVILTYNWMCMECKTCVECSDPGQEEAMIVCDKCDRGFHTFCVGLDKVPDGKWGCPKCDPV